MASWMNNHKNVLSYQNRKGFGRDNYVNSSLIDSSIMFGEGVMLFYTLLVLAVMPVVWAQPYPIPPTCYTKVLNMGKDITLKAAEIKKDNNRCIAHLPDLYIDVHNACVMPAMTTYLSMLSGMRERRCGYNRKVQGLAATIRQLYIFISQKCHGELVFTHDNCEALHHRRWSG